MLPLRPAFKHLAEGTQFYPHPRQLTPARALPPHLSASPAPPFEPILEVFFGALASHFLKKPGDVTFPGWWETTILLLFR